MDIESDSPLDVTDTTIPVEPPTAHATENATELVSGELLVYESTTIGAGRLFGTVVRDMTNYTLEVDWLEAAG